MTHIAEARVIDNHADMDGSTVHNMIRAGANRAAILREILAAQSTWDSGGSATGQGESLPTGGEGPTPRGLGC